MTSPAAGKSWGLETTDSLMRGCSFSTLNPCTSNTTTLTRSPILRQSNFNCGGGLSLLSVPVLACNRHLSCWPCSPRKKDHTELIVLVSLSSSFAHSHNLLRNEFPSRKYAPSPLAATGTLIAQNNNINNNNKKILHHYYLPRTLHFVPVLLLSSCFSAVKLTETSGVSCWRDALDMCSCCNSINSKTASTNCGILNRTHITEICIVKKKSKNLTSLHALLNDIAAEE